MHRLQNGATWLDTQGNPIHAHGGFILPYNGAYYWYGENRTDDNYVGCYRSENLMDWTFRRNILTASSSAESIRVRTNLALRNEAGGKINLERPKVLYNAQTGKFVLWAHYENGMDYSAAGCAIATCDSPDGDFTYHGHFNPYGHMSRDCTLFAEEDGTAYFLSAARGNADLHVYRLSGDYLNADEHVRTLWQGEYREAPAVMKREGRYIMLSSFCTGWAPNQCKYAVSDSMEGRWSMLCNIADETTYRSQPAFILPITGEEGTTWLYFGDRWDAKNYHRSGYVILPLRFSADGTPSMDYFDSFSLDVARGTYTG